MTNFDKKLPGDCCSCFYHQIRWQLLISCENSNSDHHKHVLHRFHPACKYFLRKTKKETPK